jgi:hypothetical protein
VDEVDGMLMWWCVLLPAHDVGPFFFQDPTVFFLPFILLSFVS